MTNFHIGRVARVTPLAPLRPASPAPARLLLGPVLGRGRALVVLAASQVTAWRRRRRTLRALRDLDRRTLADIGLTHGADGYGLDEGLPEHHRRRILRLGASFGLWH